MSDPHFCCGVVEGFYGRPWNPRQRHQLFKWMQSGGLNTYLYAPKDDIKHRACWREPYDEAEASEVAALIRDAHRHGLDFIYALAPGLDLRFADPVDAAVLETKLSQLIDLGCRHFAVLFDDIPAQLDPQSAARFASPALAQAAATNGVYAFLRQRIPEARLLFCPTVYCARMAEPSVTEASYLREIGETLDSAIGFLWTGPDIVSETVSVESIRELTGVIRRKPVIWDNLFANDYDPRRFYLGPYAGRSGAIRAEVAGILANPNCQFEVNFAPLRTFCAYLREGPTFSPREAFEEAIENWLPSFQVRGGDPFSREDVALLADLFYLPFEFGPSVRQYLGDFKRLLGTHPRGWGEERDRALQTGNRIALLFGKATALQNRDLLYSFYPQLWEIKESALLLQAWVQWRHSHPDSLEGFSMPELRPGVFRGSVVALLERMLPMDDTGHFSP